VADLRTALRELLEASASFVRYVALAAAAAARIPGLSRCVEAAG